MLRMILLPVPGRILMFEELERRAARLGEVRAGRRRERIAARVRERVRGVGVTVEDAAVVLEGRGLARRRVVDPALRWLGVESGDE